MSERQVSELLDRAVRDAPHMHLSGNAMLAAGRGRVRRRRAVGAGGVLGAAALVAAVWAGVTGGDGSLLGTTEIQPATTVWEQGEVVDATLFSGLQTVDEDQVAHSYEARLTRTAGTGPTTLVLSDGGAVVEEVVTYRGVPGLEVFAGERMTVALWALPDGVESSVPVVGPVDPGGPADVKVTEIDGTRIGWTVWAADVTTPPSEVLDVHLVGVDDVASVAGADLQVERLRAGDSRALAWTATGQDLWGYAVEGREPSLAPQSLQPLWPSGAVWSDDRADVGLTLLPEGADLDGPTDDGSEVDSVDLASRVVVLVEARDGASLDLLFTMEGQQYGVDAYSFDLGSLQVADRELWPAEGDEPGSVELRTAEGTPVVALPAEDLRSGPVRHEVDGAQVVLAVGWSPRAGVLSDARIEVASQDGSRWVAPGDVAQMSLRDGRLVTAMTVPDGEASTAVAVGEQQGDEVERWVPDVRLFDGLTLMMAGDQAELLSAGRPLERLDDGTVAGMRRYASPEDPDVSYLLAEATTPGMLVPLVDDGQGGLQPSPGSVREAMGSDDMGVTVQRVEGLAPADPSVAGVAVPLHDDQEPANSWQLLGAGDGAHVIMDPGATVTVSPSEGLWLLYPTGSTDVDRLAAGRVGGDVVELPGDESLWVAVHDREASPPVDAPPTETHDLPEQDLVVSTWSSDPRG